MALNCNSDPEPFFLPRLCLPITNSFLTSLCSSTLYQGTNQRGTVVFTWVADSNQTAFAADISPLLQYLWRTTLVSGDSYLGFIGFGTEAYHTNKNVTFSLSNYHINVSVGAAPTLPGGDPPDACSPPADAGRRFGPWRLGASISGMVAALLVFL